MFTKPPMPPIRVAEMETGNHITFHSMDRGSVDQEPKPSNEGEDGMCYTPTKFEKRPVYKEQDVCNCLHEQRMHPFLCALD